MITLIGWKIKTSKIVSLMMALIFVWWVVTARAQQTLLQEVVNSSAIKSATALPMYHASEPEIISAQSNPDSCGKNLEIGKHAKFGEHEVVMSFLLSKGGTSYKLKLQTRWGLLFDSLLKQILMPIEAATHVELRRNRKISVSKIDPDSIMNVVANDSMRASEDCAA